MKLALSVAALFSSALLTCGCIDDTSPASWSRTLSPDDKKATVAAVEASTPVPAVNNCPLAVAQCEFALRVANAIEEGAVGQLAMTATPADCPPASSQPRQGGLCGSSPGRAVSGYPVGEGFARYDDLAGFQTFLSQFATAGSSIRVLSLGCSGSGQNANATCDTFAATLGREEAGKVQALLIVGIATGTDGALHVSAAGSWPVGASNPAPERGGNVNFNFMGQGRPSSFYFTPWAP